ncbi:MAG TPA: hypothetical protein PLC48_00345 [Ferruginibacter sp.]|nr:hypothetical protein [Ferruginibacter sp.]
MKKVFFIVALTAASFAGFAQSEKEASKPLSFSVGVEAALPIGDFGDAYKFGIGGSVQADYKVAPELAITLNAGYISFSGKSVTTTYVIPTTPPQTISQTFKNATIGYVPVLAGVKYWFSDLYASGQLGLTFATGNGASGSTFTYAPGIGYKFAPIDVLVKYVGYAAQNGGSASSNIGIRVAYNF